MKSTKKQTKADTTKSKGQSPKAKGKSSSELSEDQLEHVAGGAVDAFLKIDGIGGESQDSATPKFKVYQKV